MYTSTNKAWLFTLNQGYDSVQRTVSTNAVEGNSTLFSQTRTYDNAGSLVLITSSVNGTPTDTITFDNYTDTVITGGTTTTTKYYSVNGERLAEKINGVLSYLVTDLLSNVVMAINSNGTVVAVELYEPYGQKNYAWGSMPTAYNYTGQRLDTQSGLLYYKFRWYDPLTGEFMRTDTKQNNASGMDLYAYVSDNPETKNDPTGHWGWGDILTATVVAVVAVAVVAAVVVAAPVVVAAVAAVAATDVVASVAMAAIAVAAAAPEIVTGATNAMASAAAAALAEGCGLSFRAETPVATQKGEQAIGPLQVGEKVWAYNPQTKKMELEPIEKVWLDHDDDLVDLTSVATVKNAQGKAITKKEVIHTNEKHPFLTKEKGFIPVSQLKPGMHVLEANGQYGLVDKLTLIPGSMWMYNLTVAQDHTYVVGLDQWIVHNCPNSGYWPGKYQSTTATVTNLSKSDPGVPKALMEHAPGVAAAQNAAGGRMGGTKDSCCAGTFVINAHLLQLRGRTAR